MSFTGHLRVNSASWTCLPIAGMIKTYWIQYNGDWALTKGNTFYEEKGIDK